MIIEVLKAEKGDCIHIKFGDDNNIIIDSGIKSKLEFSNKKMTFDKYITQNFCEDKKLDALILTHIDDDHIGGFFKALKKIDMSKFIQCVYMNDGKVDYSVDSKYSAKTAIEVSKYMSKYNINNKNNIIKGDVYCVKGAKITILTPTFEAMKVVANMINEKKDKISLYSGKTFDKDIDDYVFKYKSDKSLTNRASISFLFEYENKRVLFLGDANIDDVEECIVDLKIVGHIDYVKLSHHGSPYNINKVFLDSIDCNKFIISTKKCIDKQTLQLILSNRDKSEIYCNYDWWSKSDYFNKNDKDKYIKTEKLIIKEQNSIVL